MKENFTMTNIHDNDGYSERTIMEESEIMTAVETWLKENSFQDAIINEGAFMTGQSFGNRVGIEINTRDGEISGSTSYQNQYNNDDSFKISLVSIQELQADDADICEGDEMAVEITKEKFLTVLDEFDLEDLLERKLIKETETGMLKMTWWNILSEVEISAEIFVEKLMGQEWETWKEDYARWSMEDIGSNWEDEITEYYRNLREQREQEKIEKEYYK